ncbi:uncharacterized protein LOC119089298 [Pollicipes pollicipes]|uniref:uncharacterized protein LOC119089298 n=1 Tax=Pollicipes pollicipes TaxID=41117 RepID=UPI001884BAFC|nr:uncharacterized protein LOC119089298 [Pollicipes pollicipes]
MTSGNSPYVSKSARYNFLLYRSVRATPAQFRGAIPAFSAAASAAGSLPASSPPSSDTGSVGDKSTDDTSPQLEAKRQRKRKEVEKRVSNSSADSMSSDAETACSKGHLLPIGDPTTLQRRKEYGQLCRQVESLQGEVRSAQLTISRCNERERQLKHKLSEHQQRPEPAVGSRLENVTSIDIDNRSSSLIRRYGSLYTHGRAEAMAALDSLPELRNSEELKSKLLFSVVVLAFRSVTSGQLAVRETVRRQLQIPPPPPAPAAPLPPGRGDPAASERSAQLERTLTAFLQQTVDTYDLSKNVEEVCSQIWATLYDYPSLRSTEGLLSYVKESVRLAWGLINQMPPCRIEYEARTFSADQHVRHQASDAAQPAVHTYIWPALMEEAVCVHKAVVIT